MKNNFSKKGSVITYCVYLGIVFISVILSLNSAANNMVREIATSEAKKTAAVAISEAIEYSMENSQHPVSSATVVKSEEDLEKEDFTKPRAVQRYSQYTVQNSDIQDYTDVVGEESTQETSQNANNLPTNSDSTPKSFFEKKKQKIFAIFGKNKATEK